VETLCTAGSVYCLAVETTLIIITAGSHAELTVKTLFTARLNAQSPATLELAVFALVIE